MIMGIDHGYYAIKTRHFSFPAGVTAYTHEPYTLKNTLQIGGKYYMMPLQTIRSGLRMGQKNGA